MSTKAFALNKNRCASAATLVWMKHVLGIAFTLSFAFHGFAGDLAGLWKAEKKFGPDARGTLVLLRDGGNYTADFFGRIIPVKATDGQLVFGLPGEGKFRGTLNADRGETRRTSSVVRPPAVVGP